METRGSDSKESACNAEDLGLIPGSVMQPWGRECNILQYSCVENPMTDETSGLKHTAHKEFEMTEQLTLPVPLFR